MKCADLFRVVVLGYAFAHFKSSTLLFVFSLAWPRYLWCQCRRSRFECWIKRMQVACGMSDLNYHSVGGTCVSTRCCISHSAMQAACDSVGLKVWHVSVALVLCVMSERPLGAIAASRYLCDLQLV